MKKRGKGMAIMWYPVGPGGANVSTARLEMNEDGVLTVFIGAPDVGQGSSTALAQIAADAVGIPFERVRVVAADSDVTPPDHGSVGSRVTYVGGNAVRLAAEQMKENLLDAAREMLDTAVKDLDIVEGKIGARQHANTALDVAVVARHMIGAGGGPLECSASFTPAGAPVDRNTGQGVLFPSFVYATQMAEVEVDTQTGEVTVLRMVAAHDSGVVINPLLVEGQIAGGIAQGLGMALYEEVSLRDGRTLNPSLMDYSLPSTVDMPDIQFIHVETIDDAGPYGAKCVAEPSLVPTAPAILNAIYDAVGIRIHDLPATPEKILRALSSLED
jgi:CO/xanthine dehydrogenase Mo-binding subunit